MDLQERLNNIYNNFDKYFYEDFNLYSDLDVSNWVLDIEASPVNDNEVLTYSIALMNIDNDTDICYKFTSVEEVLKQLFKLKSSVVNIYIHNLYYDFKPFLIEFCNKWKATQNLEYPIEKEVYNCIKRKKEKILTLAENRNKFDKQQNTYDIIFKQGQLYQATFYGEERPYKKRHRVAQQLVFKDTMKIFPYSLKKASEDFINLELSKQGLDYNKKRTLQDKLTTVEKKYIYEDVFALKHIVKKLCIEGFDINGKYVKFTKLTNSSQSMCDYKLTLLEDYYLKQNTFSDNDFFNSIDTLLMKTKFFEEEDEDKKADMLFKKVFPPLDYFSDSWLRRSYYGGLSMVDFENVEKYEKYENKIAQVFDVNSLYPFIMLSRLLPVGRGYYKHLPYNKMSKSYKKRYPLYIQEIEIYDMKLKEGKTGFVQVKGRTDFNGRETIKENINLQGKKVPITLVLCNPLLELLFDNYDINSFELGGHIGYKGMNDLFKNYLDFWGEVKKTSKGCNRAISKLRQNALYGKFGTNCQREIIKIFAENNRWTTENENINYIDDNIYLPIATFITSYAKKYLVDSINQNREKFLYCDTDSLHVFGNLADIKGLTIHDKQYGAWKHELTFNDFKYVGAKRYAEKDIATGKWEIKCCGLTNEIMTSIDDIDTFQMCEYTPKELKNVKLYTKEATPYYYKDKECTIKVKGLFKSKKAKIVKNGTLIIESPYMLTENIFTY